MSEPFIGMMMCIPWGYPPKGWATCSGQLLPINQNQPLFSLLGTIYGGDGRVNFGLPNLNGRVALHVGPGFTQGQVGGEDSHTLSALEMPTHSHQWNATTATASLQSGAGNVMGAAGIYYSGAASGTLNSAELPSVGSNQPHENRSPALALIWVIALQGIFPSRN